MTDRERSPDRPKPLPKPTQTPSAPSDGAPGAPVPASQEATERRLIVLVGGLVVILAALVTVGFFATSRPAPTDQGAQGAGGASDAAAVATFEGLEAGHTEDGVAYAQTPPVGGRHNPTWQNCGFYADPVPNETAVHTLEHGAVWVTYRPDLPESEVQALRDLAERETYILVSPWADLPTPVVASAWGSQLRLDSVDDARFEEFVRQYRLSPDGPEPGAPCTQGTSETV